MSMTNKQWLEKHLDEEICRIIIPLINKERGRQYLKRMYCGENIDNMYSWCDVSEFDSMKLSRYLEYCNIHELFEMNYEEEFPF